MNHTATRHNHEVAEKVYQHTQRFIEQMQAMQADDLLNAPVSTVRETFDNIAVNWHEIEDAVHELLARVPEMVSEERALWFMHFELHGDGRIWWAYFQDWPEVHACLTQITNAFPCFKLKSLETCPHGLRVGSASYASTSSRQQHADALQPESARQRDKQLFQLAPLACDYLTSFIKGLGDAVPCAQCQPLPPTSTTGTPPAFQA